MKAIVYQILPRIYQDYNDKTFISVSVKEYQPYLLTKNCSVAKHNDNFCPVKTCRLQHYSFLVLSESKTRGNKKLVFYLSNSRLIVHTLKTSVL